MSLQTELKADQRALQAALDALPDGGQFWRTPVCLGELGIRRRSHDAVESEMLAIAVEHPADLSHADNLRHLSGQVERQLALDVDQAADRRFLRHLNYALRDLAADAAGLK